MFHVYMYTLNVAITFEFTRQLFHGIPSNKKKPRHSHDGTTKSQINYYYITDFILVENCILPHMEKIITTTTTHSKNTTALFNAFGWIHQVFENVKILALI